MDDSKGHSSVLIAPPRATEGGLFDGEPSVLAAKPAPIRTELSPAKLREISDRVMQKRAKLLAQEQKRKDTKVAFIDVTQLNGELIPTFARHERDTGSPEVQIALLTRRIEALTEHLRTHKKDQHSKRGLQQLATRRRKLFKYLKQEDAAGSARLQKRLGLR